MFCASPLAPHPSPLAPHFLIIDMGAFEYTALDSRGRERKGIAEGDTPRQVRQQLREQGLTPLDIAVAAGKESRAPRFSLRRGISATELALITRQLATLVRSALPVEDEIGRAHV